MVNGIKDTDKLIFDLEMYQVDYNDAKKNALRREIADKYGVPVKNVEINFIPITVDKNGDKISLTSDIISNIQDPKFQQKLFAEYVKLKEIEDVDMDAIVDIDNSINAFVDFDTYSKYKTYKFKYVKWDNYLSYGKDNYFDFTDLKGLILLSGEPMNQCGKSTFSIDLLRFALFGKADKSPSLDSVFNKRLPEETDVVVEAGIEIEGVDYVIRRTVTRPSLKRRSSKSKAKQKVEYFKLINGEYELIENCEGESSVQTNNIIRESVGNIEDFDLVIAATSKTLSDLVEMGQSDKGKLFSKWLGLVTIEEKEKIAKEKYKEMSKNFLSLKYNKETLAKENEDMQTVINEYNKFIEDTNKKIEENNKTIEKYNKEKVEILSKKKEIKQELPDVVTLEHNIASTTQQLTINRAQLTQLKTEYETVKDATFDSDAYDTKRNEVISYKTKNAEIKVEISHIKEANKKIETLIEQKICPNCGQPVNMTEKNDEITQNNKKIDDYIAQGVKNKEAIDKLNKEIAEMEVQRANVEKLNNLKLRMTAIKVQIDNYKLKLENFEKQKQEIETNKENIKYNNEINNQIRLVDENIKTETSIKENSLLEIQKRKTLIETYKREMGNRDKVIAKLTEEATIMRNWQIYQELIGKNGIVKIALKRALPIINNEISRLLKGLCDFDVEIQITDDNKVAMNFMRDGYVFDLSYSSSGLERTMASLALRAALSSLGNMPKVNCLVLDEIIGPVASSNFGNLKELFKRITMNYDFILHICHESTAEDWHDRVIMVTRDEKGISHIGLR